MSYKQTPLKKLAQKNFNLFPEPRSAWSLFLGLALGILLLLLAGLGKLLIPLFPLSFFAVGIFLYRRHPLLYVGFTWWTWFLAPLIRRLIDYKCGYVTPWPFDLTPLLVTSISGITLAKYFPKTYKQDGLPFVICLLCIIYSFSVGLIQKPITDYEREIIILLRWLTPILFSFHLFSNWKNYPSYRQNIQRVFLWGVLIMGFYGVMQFLIAPVWDKFFLFSYRNSNGSSTWMGRPEALGIRVWSTMTNTFTFAFNLSPGLILLLISKHKLRIYASIFGYLAFLLSQSRTGWYCWLITLILLICSVRGKNQIRFFIIIAVIIMITLPLATMQPFSEIIQSRIETFLNLDNDVSYNARIDQFDQSIDFAISNVFGWGLIDAGASPDGAFSSNDNGYLAIFVSFGWLVTIPYTIGIMILFLKLFLNPSNCLDLFAITSRTIALGSLMRMFTSNVTSGDYAMPIWTFLGIALAAQKYYSHQYIVNRENTNNIDFKFRKL